MKNSYEELHELEMIISDMRNEHDSIELENLHRALSEYLASQLTEADCWNGETSYPQ